VLDSFVLRLVARDRAAGRIAGEVEVVCTGERIAITSVGELLAVLGRSSDDTSGGDGL